MPPKYKQDFKGLTTQEAAQRLTKYGLNHIDKSSHSSIYLLIKQFENPFNIILLATSIVTFFIGDATDSIIVLTIIIISGLLGFYNEYKSDQSIKKLAHAVKFHIVTLRNGIKQEIESSELVPDDIIFFEIGTVIPADVELLEVENLEIDESALTGESFPVSKTVKSQAFMGTTIVNGSGVGRIINTGLNTQYGAIAKTLDNKPPKSSFEKGITSFSVMIFKIIVVMSMLIFIVNAVFKHNILEGLLFSLAIAIGLTPELLPAIITVSLTHGMKRLLKKNVVVKHLTSIEDFGNMDILCTDKTGTLTEGKVSVNNYFNQDGVEEDLVFELGLLCNTAIVNHKITGNPIDVSIWQYAKTHKSFSAIKKYKKIKDFPFDYSLRRMFSIVEYDDHKILIVKGAPEEIFELSKDKKAFQKARTEYQKLLEEGKRFAAIAFKEIDNENIDPSKEKDFVFKGIISFFDKPKLSAKESIEKLEMLGIELKILTGDSEVVTVKLCEILGLKTKGVITGEEMKKLSRVKLRHVINDYTIFAKITPDQKSEIVNLLKEKGHTVGYLGDGINDAASIKTSDVGISVDSAVDIAKETADVILLNHSLDVLADGIIEGRKTFANTIKYIMMNVSSNFGNMFSMSIASFFLPFLPMLPGQLLLNSLLYDSSQVAIPTDNVDKEYIRKPNEWNLDFIKGFMFTFGPVSSIFDILTFFVLLFFFHANEEFFHTGWFLESIITQVLIVFVIRTKAIPFFKSRTSKPIIIATFTIAIIAIVLTLIPLGKTIGFISLPIGYFVFLFFDIIGYIILLEIVKYFFYRKTKLKG